MEYKIYWLISDDYKKTYIGFSDNINRRIKEHQKGQVKTTKNFGHFKCIIVEKVNNLDSAIKREKYWKSAAGRRKLKSCFKKI